MKQDRRKVGVVVLVISVALGGLILIQSFLLASTFRSKEETFRRNALAALRLTSQRLAATEAFSFAFDLDSISASNRATISTSNGTTATITSFNSLSDDSEELSYTYSVGSDSSSKSFWVDNGFINFNLPRDQHVQVRAMGHLPTECVVFVDTFATAGSHSISFDAGTIPGDLARWEFTSDDRQIVLGGSDSVFTSKIGVGDPRHMRMIMVQSVLNQLDSADLSPIEQRIDPPELDSLLLLSLKEVGIDITPAYGVHRVGWDSLTITNNTKYSGDILKSDLHTLLFPLDIIGQANELRLFFPDRKSFIWWQMTPLLLPTVILTLIIIGAFGYTIKTILMQRKFAATLVEFVNNMTHEFKTPISTIQLACEAIARQEITDNPTRVKRFNEMIWSESRRMKDQSDKILQMALLERGEYELQREDVDLHELIRSVVEIFRLRLDETNGKIECDLAANLSVLPVDPTYFANILQNLIDNAIKYSPERPDITITTAETGSSISIAVRDHGIGIPRKERSQVFEKYYRVNQGDRHDVKGFGLGLSFVKIMTEAHGGTVSIESEPGVGTTVTLKFSAEKLKKPQV